MFEYCINTVNKGRGRAPRHNILKKPFPVILEETKQLPEQLHSEDNKSINKDEQPTYAEIHFPIKNSKYITITTCVKNIKTLNKKKKDKVYIFKEVQHREINPIEASKSNAYVLERKINCLQFPTAKRTKKPSIKLSKKKLKSLVKFFQPKLVYGLISVQLTKFYCSHSSTTSVQYIYVRPDKRSHPFQKNKYTETDPEIINGDPPKFTEKTFRQEWGEKFEKLLNTKNISLSTSYQTVSTNIKNWYDQVIDKIESYNSKENSK